MDNCIFCKIIKGEIPSKMIYQDEIVVVFHDISPKAPVHVLVVPKKHVESIIDIGSEDKELMGELMLGVQKVAQKLGLDKSGFKVVVNNGKGAGQIVFHLHLHVLGGWNVNPQWKV